MKFLIDAQLPKSLSDFLQLKGYDSLHAIELPEGNGASDLTILTISKKENRVVISKDGDFLESFLLAGVPEKLIIIKTGNIRNVDLLAIFENNIDKICSLLLNSSLIEINVTEIIVHA